MNVERTHNILFTLNADSDSTNIVELVQQLTSQLQQLANEPNNETHQNNVANSRQAVFVSIGQSRTSSFPSSWREAVHEMGLECFLSDNIRNLVEEAFSGNEITPANVHTQMQKFAATMAEKKTVLTSFLTAVETLEIGREVLEEAESEITFEIPHEAIDSDVEKFAAEIVELVKAFQPFYELVSGGAGIIKIKTVSSSKLSVTIAFSGALAAAATATSAVSEAVVDVIDAYEKVRTFRTMKNELNEKKGEKAKVAIQGLEELASQEMIDAIEVIVEKLWEKYSTDVDDAMANDIKNRVRFGIRTFAEKIDDGYGIETRMGEIPPPEEIEIKEGEEPPALYLEKQRLIKLYNTIDEAHQKQITFEGDGERILQLPKYNETD